MDKDLKKNITIPTSFIEPAIKAATTRLKALQDQALQPNEYDQLFNYRVFAVGVIAFLNLILAIKTFEDGGLFNALMGFGFTALAVSFALLAFVNHQGLKKAHRPDAQEAKASFVNHKQPL